MTIRLILLFWVILYNTRSFAQQFLIQPALTEKEIKTLDSISLQDVVENGPGIATGIVRNGQIIYQKYGGYANLKDSTLLSKDSRFNIASNAKQFTALAILILIENKQIHINDDIRIFLPDLYPEVKYRITIANLLNHSSGIRDVYELWSLQGITWWERSYANSDVIALLKSQKELNFEPGTRYLYSNSNYILLAEIVKKVSGVSFTQYMNSLFTKLKMLNTSFVDDYKLIQGPIANPYFNFETWTGYEWITNIEGDGNLFTTLPDQLQWECILQSKHSKFLSASLLSGSQQPIANASIRTYGYGLEFGTYKNINYTFHEGATGAWKATTIRFPKDKIAVVTLTNSGKAVPSQQSRQAADIVLGLKNEKQEYLTQPVHTGPFIPTEDVVGTYQTENDFTFRFELKDTSLFLLRSGRNDVRLVRESDNLFHQWNDSAFKQEFKLNTKKEMEVTAYYTTHAPYSLKRENINWEGYAFEDLNATFHNQETGVNIKLNYQKDKIYTITIGDQTGTALLISPVKLLTDRYQIEISKNKKGDNSKLLVNGNRIKKVTFLRIP